MRKVFPDVQSIEQLNIVNDAQKASFDTKAYSSANVAAIREERESAYLARWKEALAYVPMEAKLLDIGSGWPIPRIWEAVVRDHRVNYHALDVSPGEIEAAKNWLATFGLPPGQAIAGGNTSLPFPPSYFDFVFSSHCLEHSTNLVKTFEEIGRVLKPDGTLFFAVPFGFDTSDEHLLYFSSEEWVTFTQLMGFKVINIHLGRVYAPDWDLAIVAKHDRTCSLDAAQRLLKRNNKASRTFIDATESVFRYTGPVIKTTSHRILTTGCAASISTPEVLTILFRQTEDSGVLQINNRIIDLYSAFHTTGSVHVSKGAVRIRCLGAGRGGDQVIIEGALLGKKCNEPIERIPLWRKARRRVGRLVRRFVPV